MPRHRGKVCIVGRNPDAIWFNDYEDRVLFDEAGTVRLRTCEEAKLTMINKQLANAAEAVADVFDGATIMIGGFGEAGSPIELIHALIDQGATNFTVINNNTGSGEVGLAALIKAKRVSKMICSYPRTANSTVFPKLYRSGDTELELVPQGTLAERIQGWWLGYSLLSTRRLHSVHRLVKEKNVAQSTVASMCLSTDLLQTSRSSKDV